MKKIVIYFLFLSHLSFASKIKSGFEALQVFNYFKAKQLFEKSLKKQTSPAAFGLATIFFRQDNPFHNIDSAYRYVLISEKSFIDLSQKKCSILEPFGFSFEKLTELKSNISNVLFIRSKKIFTEESFSQFVIDNPWSSDVVEAIHLRDSIAFTKADLSATPEAYSLFLTKYPNSEYSQLVKKSLDYNLFRVSTADGLLSSYHSFLNTNPTNYYTQVAEDSIFFISTKELTISSLYRFILNNPKNNNIQLAWKKLQQLYTTPYTAYKIEQFISDYPDYPFIEALNLEKGLLDKMFYPYKKDTLYGWMDEYGQILTPPIYEFLNFFSEGLALTVKDGRYGFIDKSFNVLIPFEFEFASDFEFGLAQVVKSGKYGVIDKLGNFTLRLDFDEISSINNEGILAKKDGLYYFYNLKGIKLFEKGFEDAYGFDKNIAKVVLEGRENYISSEGVLLFIDTFLSISRITDSIFVFQKDSLFGLIDFNQNVVQEPIYSLISSVENDGLILFQLKDKVGFFNLNGKIAIPAKYDVVSNILNVYIFKNSYARVSLNHKWGVINSNGKWLILPTYKSMLGEISDLIFFEKEGRYGCLNFNNEVVLSPRYVESSLFINGLGVVNLSDLLGVINLKGKQILPHEFSFIQNIEGKILITKKNDYFSLFNSNGDLISAQPYIQFRILNKDLVVLTTSNRIDYFSISKMKLISVLN